MRGSDLHRCKTSMPSTFGSLRSSKINRVFEQTDRSAYRPVAEDAFQCLLAVPHHMDLVREIIFPKRPQRDFHIFGIVFDQ